MDVRSTARSDLADFAREVRERSRPPVWRFVAAVEAALCALAVLLDLLVPTFVMLGLLAVSLLARREGLGSIGFHRARRPMRLVGLVCAVTAGWAVTEVLVLIPALEHLTGQRQVTTDFSRLQGDAGLLLLLLLISWTIAAIGEEAAYRGYLFTRLSDLLGRGALGVLASVVISSTLFGLAHTEQGLVGVLLSAIDGAFFTVLRLHFRTLWASVVAHGVSNTLGLVAFFLVGQLPSPW